MSEKFQSVPCDCWLFDTGRLEFLVLGDKQSKRSIYINEKSEGRDCHVISEAHCEKERYSIIVISPPPQNAEIRFEFNDSSEHQAWLFSVYEVMNTSCHNGLQESTGVEMSRKLGSSLSEAQKKPISHFSSFTDTIVNQERPRISPKSHSDNSLILRSIEKFNENRAFSQKVQGSKSCENQAARFTSFIMMRGYLDEWNHRTAGIIILRKTNYFEII